LKTATTAQLGDVEVIRLYLQTQDTAYFTLLYDRYASKVYFKCLSLLKQEDLAKDAVQDIFTKILLSLSSFSERSKFSTWIYSITYNYCIDSLRKRKRGAELFTDDMGDLPDVADEVTDEAIYTMEIDALREVLAKLPEGDKAVLMMKYQDDMSIKEIAEALNRTESSTKMKIMRAKNRAFELYQQIMKSKNS
jgi:RNA polymerase sigma-70 factor (ECF subfamily)